MSDRIIAHIDPAVLQAKAARKFRSARYLACAAGLSGAIAVAMPPSLVKNLSIAVTPLTLVAALADRKAARVLRCNARTADWIWNNAPPPWDRPHR